MDARRFDPDSPHHGEALLAFSYLNRFSMALLYRRTGRLTAKTNGGFRPGQWRCLIALHKSGGTSIGPSDASGRRSQ